MFDPYEYVISKLNFLGVKIYTDYVPTDKVYQYIQIQFPNALPNGCSELNMLKIDIWDKSHSKARVEDIADNIDKIFKKHNETTSDFCIQIFRNNPYRLNIPDPNNEIRHRQLRYVLKIYRKG